MAKNKLEKAFDLGVIKLELEKYYFIFNQPDIPPLFSKKLRFKPKQLPDRLLASKINNKYLLIEIKKNKNARMRFDRVAEHQEQYLIEWQEKAGEAYLLISFDEFKRVVLISIKQFLKLKRIVKKEAKNGERRGKGKSFNMKDLEKIEYQEIEKEKLRVNYRLDLTFLIPNQQEIISFL
jgi:penicillin-binding protein-related factor A (putative recombinase)